MKSSVGVDFLYKFQLSHYARSLCLIALLIASCNQGANTIGALETRAQPVTSETKSLVQPELGAAQPLTPTQGNEAAFTPTPTAPVWQWLTYDPNVWREKSFLSIELRADATCTIWMDRGTDYPHDLRIEEKTVQIGGRPWKRWVFIKPDGKAVAESYSPIVYPPYGWYHLNNLSESCRASLMELLEKFPWDRNIRPMSFPTITPEYPLSSEMQTAAATQAGTNTAWAATVIAHSTSMAGTAWANATATALALTPPAPYIACTGSMPSRLRSGMRAYVSTDTTVPNSVRQAGEKSAPLVAIIDPGTIVSLIAGPKCGDGLIWWQVRMENGKTGWTAEGDQDSYWLTPCPTSGVCQPEG